MNPLLPGAVLTVAVGSIAAQVWGRPAIPATLIFGAVATLIQVVAYRLSKRPTDPLAPFPAGWLQGMALRFGGVVAFAVAVAVNRTVFPPLPTALGYLGVIIPLLALELRRTR